MNKRKLSRLGFLVLVIQVLFLFGLMLTSCEKTYLDQEELDRVSKTKKDTTQKGGGITFEEWNKDTTEVKF